MIELKDVSKNFKVHKKQPGLKNSIKSLFVRSWITKKALNQVSLSVGAGEILGLVGANGAGKTTLIKILSGILYPDQGEITVLGCNPWNRESRFRRNISLIIGQKAQLWWDLPALDCFLLLKEIYQIPEKEYADNIHYLTQALDVKAQLNIQIRRLSLGERMKMELIAALLHSPKVVFFDEPTIGLDITAQRRIRKFILEYRNQNNPAMIITSHYMQDIEQLCERVAILRKGELVYDGSLLKIKEQYIDKKLITVRTKNQQSDICIPEDLGIVSIRKKNNISVKVKKNKVKEAASFLLNRFDVEDLSIEEEDISNTIEAIMRGEKFDEI